jgi:hypothetical protein
VLIPTGIGKHKPIISNAAVNMFWRFCGPAIAHPIYDIHNIQPFETDEITHQGTLDFPSATFRVALSLVG